MVYNVRVTDKAKTDLDEIIRYIAEKLSNVTAAANLLADFVKQKNNLQNSPYMYPLCNDIRLQKKGYHSFLKMQQLKKRQFLKTAALVRGTRIR